MDGSEDSSVQRSACVECGEEDTFCCPRCHRCADCCDCGDFPEDEEEGEP